MKPESLRQTRFIHLWRDPPLALRLAERALGIARAQVLFWQCQRGPGLCATGKVRVAVEGHAEFGERVTFLGGMVPSEVEVGRGAELKVGDETLFNYGVSLHVSRSVQVGRRCMFASFVRVSDAGRSAAAPVVIGDDVWVAHGAIIEAGVTIGEGSVVSAGSVVTRSIPPHSLAMGNPARAMSLTLVSPS